VHQSLQSKSRIPFEVAPKRERGGSVVIFRRLPGRGESEFSDARSFLTITTVLETKGGLHPRLQPKEETGSALPITIRVGEEQQQQQHQKNPFSFCASLPFDFHYVILRGLDTSLQN